MPVTLLWRHYPPEIAWVGREFTAWRALLFVLTLCKWGKSYWVQRLPNAPFKMAMGPRTGMLRKEIVWSEESESKGIVRSKRRGWELVGGGNGTLQRTPDRRRELKELWKARQDSWVLFLLKLSKWPVQVTQALWNYRTEALTLNDLNSGSCRQ